jgi:hypothetical protein
MPLAGLKAQQYARPQDGFSAQQYSGQYSGHTSDNIAAELMADQIGMRDFFRQALRTEAGRLPIQLMQTIAPKPTL